uniref:Uncharacterized protein n=1 Tax=Populus trichocarpa TaxID=3694 RepID=A0A2K2BQC3_POPTR
MHGFAILFDNFVIVVWNWKGYSIRYQNAGNSGPALVLAHGFGANRTLPLSSSPVVAWKLPSLANLFQQQIHLPQGLPAPTCCWKLPPAADSLLLFPLDFCRSFSWLVLIKPSPSEYGCGMPFLVLSMKASMMETQEEKDRFRKVSQRLTEHLYGIVAMVTVNAGWYIFSEADRCQYSLCLVHNMAIKLKLCFCLVLNVFL